MDKGAYRISGNSYDSQLVPSEFIDLNVLRDFKAAIAKWKPNNFPCRLCKVYIRNFFKITYLGSTIDAGWSSGFFAYFTGRRDFHEWAVSFP